MTLKQILYDLIHGSKDLEYERELDLLFQWCYFEYYFDDELMDWIEWEMTK